MDYLIFEKYSGTWHDAEKSISNPRDDALCWAAAAANVLAWTGWGFPESQNFLNVYDIFNYFKSHWQNEKGYPERAWEWWFNGKDFEGVNISGGGFWEPLFKFKEFIHSHADRNTTIEALKQYLNEGRGVVLELMNLQYGSHYVTCWGYKYNDQNECKGIFLTDSDDQSAVLASYDIYQGGVFPTWWYLHNYCDTNDYFIAQVHALDRKTSVPSAPTNIRILTQ